MMNTVWNGKWSRCFLQGETYIGYVVDNLHVGKRYTTDFNEEGSELERTIAKHLGMALKLDIVIVAKVRVTMKRTVYR
jgi:hypothetical protein